MSWDNNYEHIDHRSQWRYKEILKELPYHSKILDIGTTKFTMRLAENPWEQITTLDLTGITQQLCDDARVKLVVHNLENLPLPFEDEAFDVIIFTEVLEHLITAPQPIFKELNRIIKWSGKLIFSTPNLCSLANRWVMLMGKCPFPPAEEQFKQGQRGYGHPRLYTMDECVKYIADSGFRFCNRRYIHPELESKGPASEMHHLICKLVPQFRASVFITAMK